jgi:hypothetical protein
MKNNKIVTSVQSSNIDLVEYYPDELKLGVVFTTGHKYMYDNVTEEVYKDFLNSPSKGTYFNKFIRSLYECEKII